MKYLKNVALFSVGGGAYVGLELLYRGRSHISMFGAGGTCFLLLGRLRKAAIPYVLRIVAGAGTITAVELAAGLLVNRDHHVWDYRGMPGNYRGQICPQFAAVWIPVTAAAMGLFHWTEERLDKLAAGITNPGRK